MAKQLNEFQVLAIAKLSDALVVADHGRKSALVEQCAETLRVSAQTVRRWLKERQVVRAARTRRSDAGTSAMSYAEMRAVSGALYESIRKTGNRIMCIDDAVGMLVANGVVAKPLSASRVSTLLTKNGLHPTQLSRPTPAVEQRSLHANHVWQVDASVCVAFYLSNATGLHVMDEKTFYKNKPKNLTRIQSERLIRYVVVDHYSHTFKVRYFLGSESTEHLGSVLMWAFSPTAPHAMHGVPLLLQMDMGSANTSGAIKHLLERLEIAITVHERHNSRANGSVEKAHHMVERYFESALRFKHIEGLDDLNTKALDWAHDFCATRAHTRYDNNRYAAWLTISAVQLRLAPDAELMRDLVATMPELRRVSNNLTVSFVPLKGEGSKDYDVRHVPGVRAGDKVRVRVNVYRRPVIDVEYSDAATGECHWMQVEPTERDAMGFMLSAPIIGQEYRQGHRGIIDRAREDVLIAAYGDAIPSTATTHSDRVAAAEAAKEKGALVFGGAVDPFKRVADADLPAYMPKRGTALEAPATRRVDAARLPTFEACSRIHAGLKRLGAAHAYDAATVYPWIEARFGAEGMPDDQVDATCQLLMANAARPAGERNDTPLRAIGGGNGGTDA